MGYGYEQQEAIPEEGDDYVASYPAPQQPAFTSAFAAASGLPSQAYAPPTQSRINLGSTCAGFVSRPQEDNAAESAIVLLPSGSLSFTSLLEGTRPPVTKVLN